MFLLVRHRGGLFSVPKHADVSYAIANDFKFKYSVSTPIGNDTLYKKSAVDARGAHDGFGSQTKASPAP